MKHTKQFIEDAIEGGWAKDKQHANYILNLPDYAKCQLWLDPTFWQAVGKTRGWDDHPGDAWTDPDWQSKWHHFISQLASGKTIEDALAAISN